MIAKERLEEIATNALHHLMEIGELEAFEENYDVRLTETECEYFGLEESEND